MTQPIYKFEVCEVICNCCGIRYDTVEYEDDIPFFCDNCLTPCLRVISREATEFTPLYDS